MEEVEDVEEYVEISLGNGEYRYIFRKDDRSWDITVDEKCTPSIL